MRYDREASALLASQFGNLREKAPDLYSIALLIEGEAVRTYGVEPTITSIFRLGNDPNKLHQNNRAIDFRVYNRERDGQTEELTLEQWKKIADFVNNVFRYGRLNSKPWKSSVCVHVLVEWDGNKLSPNTHVHVQIKGKGFWS